MFELKEKVALVTGGSRGIGRAISVSLGKQGAYVAVNYAGNEAAAAETLAAIRAAGGDGELLRFDVSNVEAAAAQLDDLVKRRGKLDILVNNAGVAIDQLLIRVSPEEVEKTFSINVTGTLFLTKAAIRHMMKKRVGRVVTISSVVGESGNPGQAVYSASKAALLGLTKTLAREYASRGITVNAVTPGFIETDMTAVLPEQAKASIVQQTPLGRVGSPDEVAAAVVFLASNEASYITGQTLRVNGGMYV